METMALRGLIMANNTDLFPLFQGNNLEVLNLAYNQLQQVPTDAIKHMSTFLETLTLSGNHIDRINSQAFAGLTALQNLYLRDIG